MCVYVCYIGSEVIEVSQCTPAAQMTARKTSPFGGSMTDFSSEAEEKKEGVGVLYSE